MEERVARLEAGVEHLREDFKRVEGKFDKLETKFDGLNNKIDAVEKRLEAKIDSLKDAIAKMAASRMGDRVWQLLASGALLGVMARGFKWI